MLAKHSGTTMGDVGASEMRLSALRAVFAAKAVPTLPAELASLAASSNMAAAVSMPWRPTETKTIKPARAIERRGA